MLVLMVFEIHYAGVDVFRFRHCALKRQPVFAAFPSAVATHAIYAQSPWHVYYSIKDWTSDDPGIRISGSSTMCSGQRHSVMETTLSTYFASMQYQPGTFYFQTYSVRGQLRDAMKSDVACRLLWSSLVNWRTEIGQLPPILFRTQSSIERHRKSMSYPGRYM